MKRLTVKQLKNKLDIAFSQWIRLRGSTEGYNTCFTCGVRKSIKELQNGHYQSRSFMSTRFDPDNCRPQCVACNIFKRGNLTEFAYRLEEETPGITKELYKRKNTLKHFSYQEYLDLLETYGRQNT